MKIVAILTCMVLVGCTDTVLKKDSRCSQECKKPYGVGNKYQHLQKKKRCQKRCEKQKNYNVTK